jgi:hypothetical protein
VADLG